MQRWANVSSIIVCHVKKQVWRSQACRVFSHLLISNKCINTPLSYDRTSTSMVSILELSESRSMNLFIRQTKSCRKCTTTYRTYGWAKNLLARLIRYLTSVETNFLFLGVISLCKLLGSRKFSLILVRALHRLTISYQINRTSDQSTYQSRDANYFEENVFIEVSHCMYEIRFTASCENHDLYRGHLS